MNTVKIDYFAVTVKNMAPERVLTDILFYHLSSISRHLIKNRLNSIIKLRNLSIFELRFSVKSVLKNNALPSDFFDKVLQSYGINNFTDFG